MMKAQTAGVPPTDLRKWNRGDYASRAAHAFLEFAHQNLAEPLAEGANSGDTCYIAMEQLPGEHLDDPDETPLATEASVDNIVSSMSVLLQSKEQKWLPWQTITDLYSTMKSWITGTVEHDDVPSYRTFLRVWDVWAKTFKLRIRRQGQHARCTMCAELSQRLATTHDEEVKAEIIATRDRHLTSMFADRDLEYRLNALSETSSSSTCTFHGRVLKVDIDGMDQAKFKCPRNVSNAHSLKDAWRPMLHVVGILCWGVFEFYATMAPDVPKDSNMQITLLCMAISLANDVLTERCLTMPAHLIVQADNTCRETKNSAFLTFCSLLVVFGVFKSVSVHFHRVGHTHGPLDQRFSILATVVARCSVLETIEDFIDVLERSLPEIRSRKLFVRHVQHTFDFVGWMWLRMGIKTPGITPNPHTGDLHTNHAWRIMRRENLQCMKQANSSQWIPMEMLELSDAHEHDAVVLLKEFESSQALTQNPLVVVPWRKATKMLGSSPSVWQRDPIGQRSASEYLKTATLVEKEPWNHCRAAAWLRKWVSENQSGVPPLRSLQLLSSLSRWTGRAIASLM